MPSLNHCLSFMLSLIEQLSYLGIYFVITLEYACFPIPSEIILPFVGMSIPATQLEFFPAYILSILAGLTGSLICYLIGLYGGTPLLNWFGQREQGFQKAHTLFITWFSRYGRWAVLFSRIVPLTRTYISFFGGINEMSLIEFLLYSTVGIAAWNLILMSLGFYLGYNWELIESILNTYSHIVLGIGALCILLLLVYRWHQLQIKKS